MAKRFDLQIQPFWAVRGLKRLGLCNIFLGMGVLFYSGFFLGVPAKTVSPKMVVTSPTGKKFYLEQATTPQQKEKGLMFRSSLEQTGGMLFRFKPEQYVGIWMKNCLISLDLVFIRRGIVQTVYPNVPPCTKPPCQVYESENKVDTVVELSANSAALAGMVPGAKVVFSAF